MNTTSIDASTEGRMSPAHLALLIWGVLLLVGGPVVFSNLSGLTPLLTGLGMLVSGLALIIVGAAGVGRGLLAQASTDPVSHAAYPAQLTGQLDPHLSRWRWLVKWILAIPHFVVLWVLWIAFLVVTFAAGVAILLTGRYPASLFQFAVGVLRWSWRVSFYASGVLGTDRYPPFTLARTDYPATFDVLYPARLANWKVLFKSWLLALPHLLIISAFTGGIWASASGQAANGISLLGVLVLITAMILLFTGVYRLGLFNLLVGINRWMYRAFAYAALMRDEYPPFRLDQGPFEPMARPSRG
jgi:hypothetical protein